MTVTEPTHHTTHGNGAYFPDIASAALARRTVLGGALGLTVAAAGSATPAVADSGATLAGRGRGRGRTGDSPLRFKAIAPVPDDVDDVTVPRGFQWNPVIRWGDPILPGAPAFDVNAQTPESQAAQFGYNCDYLDILVTDAAGKKGVLCCNHEYTNENIMFPPGTPIETQARVGIEAHGFSVVELSRKARKRAWSYVPDGKLNRRFTGSTPFAVDGPAAGSDLLKTAADPEGRTVLGTLNNCSGSTTPWGTILSGEENCDQYFYCEGTPEEKRYSMGPLDLRQWRTVDPRFDATKPEYKNEPNRFFWVVEIDPHDPTSTPVKHTAMGRFKHEAASIRIAPDGRAVAYSGDDERFEYVYKFVSRGTYQAGNSAQARAHNKTLLSEGDLYVAVFTGDGMEDGVNDGTGRWVPLVKDGASHVPDMTVEQVLVYTRLAADKVGATKMDRPEDVQPSPTTGHVYIALTNNTQRGTAGKAGVDEANPRVQNAEGHVIELIEDGGNAAAVSFSWNMLLICGTEDTAGTYFGGWTGPVSPISCPDNVAFDSSGVLWVSTDGQPGTIGYNDALHMVPVTGTNRGQVQQFLAVPAGAETCGPVIHDKDESVFVAVQHPGENGTWEAPTSRFPDYIKPGESAEVGEFAGPRPTVIQVTRKR